MNAIHWSLMITFVFLYLVEGRRPRDPRPVPPLPLPLRLLKPEDATLSPLPNGAVRMQAFHGEIDVVLPPEGARELAERLLDADALARSTGKGYR